VAYERRARAQGVLAAPASAAGPAPSPGPIRPTTDTPVAAKPH
jgi:hypothetical protein